MKNSLLYLVVLVLAFFIISASSCHKEDPEPDLVPITTTGANTMGFYLDGVPVNIRGEYGGLLSKGVKYSYYSNNTIGILGSGVSPNWTIVIFIPIDSIKDNSCIIDHSLYRYMEISYTDNSPLGGNEFLCDSLHTGYIEFKKFDMSIISGTFHFTAIHKETGKVIKVTDGRFDIKRD